MEKIPTTLTESKTSPPPTASKAEELTEEQKEDLKLEDLDDDQFDEVIEVEF